MLLNLQGIVELPGGKVTFDFEPDLSQLLYGSISRVIKPVRASGNVTNTAGMLCFTAQIKTTFICICARCLKEFEYPINKIIKADITEHGDGEDPDGYFMQTDTINAEDIIISEMILNIDDTLICREDCAGLCQKCGADLNNGKCDCLQDIDPRWEILKNFKE